MRRPAIVPPEPRKRNYTRLLSLDAKGWLRELTRLYRLSVIANAGLHSPTPNIRVDGKGCKTAIAQIGVPIVEFVPRDSTGVWLPPDRLPAMIVDFNAPDGVIGDEMDRVLSEARKRFGAPTIKRGRNTHDSKFDEKTKFRMWRNKQIVPLGDLFIWRALSPKYVKYYTDHDLGQLIGIQEPKDVSEAKKALVEALAALPALAAQVAQEMIPLGSKRLR